MVGDSVYRMTPQGEILALAGFIAGDLAAGNPTAVDEGAFFHRADSGVLGTRVLEQK